MTTHRTKEERREQIIDAAVTCFSEKGYHEASMDDIAVTANLSKGSLYWHFKGKRELFQGLVERWLQEFTESLGTTLEQAATAGEKQYFGSTAEELEAKQTLGNIERTSIPVLILVAEFDPDKFQIGTAKLFQELLVEKGAKPRIRQMRGHNHTSYIASIGTADTQAAEEILDFITTTGGRP